MGEKDCYESGGIRLAQPQIFGQRIASPFGEGFTPANLTEILGGGASGYAALTKQAGLPAETTADGGRRAAQIMRGAPQDAGRRVQAAGEAAAELDQTAATAGTQVSRSEFLYRIVGDAGSFDPAQVAQAARSGARLFEDAANNDDFAFLRDVAQDMVEKVEDAAVSTAGAKLDAARHRFTALASRSTDRLLRGIEQRGAADAPDPGAAA